MFMQSNPIHISTLEAPLPLPNVAPLAIHNSYPQHAQGVPPGVLRSGRYAVRFARSAEDLRDVQRLRFAVFNLELHEGLTESYATGLDQDAFDLRCHHLMVCDAATATAVGTYRLMTAELARRHELYTDTEFDLSAFPEHVIKHGAEVGRACVAREHRNGRVLQLLWRGIARYLDWNDKRYVFGCCSVPTLDAGEIAGLSLKLAREDHLHLRIRTQVRPGLRATCEGDVVVQAEAPLPPLFASYLRLGAKVCGGPAFDREFQVTDYLVLLDLRDVDTRTLSGLAAPGLWRSDASAA